MKFNVKEVLLIVALIIIIGINIVGIVEIAKINKEIESQNQANYEELQEAIRQRQEKEVYVAECVKNELETDGDVVLNFFKLEEYQNGYIAHYVAEVNEKAYFVEVKYVDDKIEVDVISQIGH